MTTTELRLGVYQLPQPEAGLVRALLSLLTIDCQERRWRMVDEGPFDAMVVDSRFAHQPDLQALAPAILRIAPPGSESEPDTLARPIRAEQLSAWLEAAQARALARVGLGPQTTPLAPPAPRAQVADHQRYKLRRWPPAEALHGDPLRQRMAALLARKPMTVVELATASQLPAERCRAFIQTLRSLAVLVAEEASPASPLPAAAAPAARATPDPRRSLVSSLRRRLGL